MLNTLSRSRFRSSFKLDDKDLVYIDRVGLEKIELHARDFITNKLAPAKPRNDGKQTPFKGHPIFKAQHATATCCRSCFKKWYKIPKGRELSPKEIDRALNVVMGWVMKQLESRSQE